MKASGASLSPPDMKITPFFTTVKSDYLKYWTLDKIILFRRQAGFQCSLITLTIELSAALSDHGMPFPGWQTSPPDPPKGFSPGFEPVCWGANLPNYSAKVPLYQSRGQMQRLALISPLGKILLPRTKYYTSKAPCKPELKIGQSHHVPPALFMLNIWCLVCCGQ